jgi:Protein of unknown function (DUF2580).
MVGDRIAIDGDLLEAHARNIERVAVDVRQAIQAAGQTMLSAGAFGLMCSWMVPPFLGVAGASTAAMTSAANALDRSARELRATRADFDQTEEGVVAALRDLGQGLDAR